MLCIALGLQHGLDESVALEAAQKPFCDDLRAWIEQMDCVRREIVVANLVHLQGSEVRREIADRRPCISSHVANDLLILLVGIHELIEFDEMPNRQPAGLLPSLERCGRGQQQRSDVVCCCQLHDRSEIGLELTRWHPQGPCVATLRGHGSMGALKLLYERFIALWGGASRTQGNYCAGEAELGFISSFGNLLCHDIRDVQNSETVILWGRNPAATQIHLVPWLRMARQQGTRLLLVDPVVTEISPLVDQQIKPRPGSDHELAQAVAAVILKQGWMDESFVSENTDEFETYRRHIESVEVE